MILVQHWPTRKFLTLIRTDSGYKFTDDSESCTTNGEDFTDLAVEEFLFKGAV